MSIELFEHNRQAYDSVVAMLAAARMACVIHPTGTGKSFIGFKLCEDNPEKTVCWLSPSDYIFRTQLENLAAAVDGWQPENIRFFTYAKLMNMTDDEIADIKPDHIILDEFHRCGAQMWGEGVQRLLAAFPDVPILGLSATAIRYLDDQRNMAEELFDSCIASEMTLGEAIVRGILAPPKYVLSMFSYQKDLKRYEDRVKKAKYKAIRDEASKYLDALKRALENAEGLDVIFDKHMTDRHGKYIVFATNYEHLSEYRKLAGDWFSRIDLEPHIYSVYTPDPSTSAEFDAFKEDSSDHLKLLFCIDALNEGIHIPDISGVILMRPTVSPIIFKQQIGRALSTSAARVPIIFDIVNNIENLYSVDSLKEEMETAIAYYRSHFGERYIVNDSFEIIDKVADCRELFDRLEDTLSSSWDMMYEKLVEYHKVYGNVDVPFDFKTDEGYSLGNWVDWQRKCYRKKVFGLLTAERITKLDKLGMRWLTRSELSWQKHYAAAVRYYSKYNNLDVPQNYIDEEGVRLGQWILSIRTQRNRGLLDRSMYLERIDALDRIGMIWDKTDHFWEQNYRAAVNYFKTHGDLNVPTKYIDQDGIKLGKWIIRIRTRQKNDPNSIPTEKKELLDAIGMVWGDTKEIKWESHYILLCKYKEKYGHINVPASYVIDGVRLGSWVAEQRRMFRDNTLNEYRKEKLDKLGMVWKLPDAWEQRYLLAKKYYEEYGNINVANDLAYEGVWLCRWLNEQRLIGEGKRKGKSLTSEQKQKLEALGMVFGKTNRLMKWEERYSEAKAYYLSHHCLIIDIGYTKANGEKLINWIYNQRTARRRGKLSSERIRMLDAIGMVW
ncbi:Superfamily II DNA or RNA helicase [Ruminococcaceae bacterium FB2012]|nr:Superfamily II DNA or RNA helicase [Ruminococcaceae bacterium FB2012]